MGEAALATFFALAAAVGWGFGDFFGAKASKLLGATTAVFYVSLAGLLFYTPLYLFVMEPGGSLWSSGGVFAAAGGVLTVIALFIFFRALVAGPVSAVVPITAAYPLFTMITGLAIFGAVLTGLQVFAIGIVVLGIMATSGLFNLTKSERRLSRGPVLALVASVVYGVGFALVAQAVERIGWQTATMVQLLSATAFLILVIWFLPEGKHVLQKFRLGIKNKFVMGNAVFGTAGLTCLNIAFVYDQTSGSVVSAISACYPILTIVLALHHFKEEVRLVPLLGAAASIAGIVLLSV